MRRFKLLVMTDPFEGQDDAYNKWYTEQHLGDLVALPGFAAAQRFTLHSVTMGAANNKYLAIYDIETDDPEGVIANMFAAQGTPAMPIDPSLNVDSANVFLFEELTEVVRAKDKV